MGRYYWDKKDTAEECDVLSLSRLREWGLLKGYAVATMTWTRGLSGRQNSVELIVDVTENPHIKLMYPITDREGNKSIYDYQVTLTITKCNLGGIRYWFICPISKNGNYCGKRVGKLYLPPGGKYFGCRHCYNLSYESRNESRIGRFGQIGYPLKAERQYEELYLSIKRWTWRGRPTKKARKLQALEQKMDRGSKIDELFWKSARKWDSGEMLLNPHSKRM